MTTQPSHAIGMQAIAALGALLSTALAAEQLPIISPAISDDDGFLVHEVRSPFQEGKTRLRLLLPDSLKVNQKCPAIYVLPVEARGEARYGDGLAEVKKHDLHNKHQVVFVAPTFSQLPWYADHPDEPAIRQESHFLKIVVPFIESTYPVQANPEGRLLLGFSKSGWGAWSLLLHHPDVFGRAAAWDAPLMMDQLGKYGTAPIFGTEENFEKYRITELLRTKGERLGITPRLILTGYGNFHREHEQVHQLMDELKIPHEYRNGLPRKHDWHSGWLPEAVELLVSSPSR